MITLKLTKAEAEALHGLIAVVLNDPDWYKGNEREQDAIDRADGKLLAAMHKEAS